MITYLYIGLGSALGGMARHGVSTWMAGRFPGAFPWGTLVVNVLGSFLIGLIASLPESRWPGAAGGLMRQFLTIGFLGGFTTFSAFSLQAVSLAQHGRAPVSLLYVLLSVMLCLAGAALGYFCATGSWAAKP